MTLYARRTFQPEGDPLDHAHTTFDRYPFATLVAHDPTGDDPGGDWMHAVHTPVLVERAGSGLVLRAHVARANPWWRRIEERPEVLAIATGPHAAISASWYAKPSAGTWNYLATHARCRARTIHDEHELRPFLERLTARFETDPEFQPGPEVTDTLVKAIVGVELTVVEASSTVKMSQNKDDQTHANIVRALAERAQGDDEVVASIMRSQRSYPGGMV